MKYNTLWKSKNTPFPFPESARLGYKQYTAADSRLFKLRWRRNLMRLGVRFLRIDHKNVRKGGSATRISNLEQNVGCVICFP